ncbi:MAG: hypothetical protein LUD72_11535 [Bacteroidales bacterium]|nr:hypothetical protein [Bacteroidales bacterium]
MTKTKKIAAAAVAVALAGTMAVGLSACGKKKETNSYGDGVVNMALADGASLGVAIGYDSANTGLFYGQDTGSTHKWVGGYTAYNGAPKPTAQAIMDATGISLTNKYGGSKTSANLNDVVNNHSWGDTVQLATSDLTVAIEQASNSDNILNLADYLDYMPNFKAFLEENPIVYLSVMGEGMREDGSGQTLYVAPYFDGMDDIEKGCLMRQDWVEAVLDEGWIEDPETNNGGASNDTFKTACYAVTSTTDGVADQTEATSTYATSYMGTTGSWTIESTSETGNDTITIKKDYGAALAALEDTDNGLAQAYCEIAGDNTAYSGVSGNIVDIMNAAIKEDLEVDGTHATGENLAALYKAYVDTAYTYSTDGTNFSSYYGSTEGAVKYSKIFTGYSACWDVDDLVALLRIIKCSSGQVGLGTYTNSQGEEVSQKTVGIYPRDYTNSRTPDLISLVGELYGVRGATSRYENVYFDKEGKLNDARADEKFWESLEAFGGLAKEGLVDSGYILNGIYNPSDSNYQKQMQQTVGYTSDKVGFMQWDYSQTQTTQEFDDDTIEYGWVNTPVSIWDDGTSSEAAYSNGITYSYTSSSLENGERANGKYMRFTDSWRSTKTAGLVVSKSVEKNEKQLAAALTFVDYLYSNDGQITTTYAIQSTNGNNEPNGTWYGTPVNATQITENGTFESICEETYQYVIKDEYSKDYVVYKDQICDKDGNPQTDDEGEPLDLDTYATKISSYAVKAEYQSECFAFDGQLYSGTLYKGKMTPTITNELFEHFTMTSESENYSGSEVETFPSVRGSFTNFARYILGSTLPICVKDQSFENQMTADFAKDSATRISVSIANKTIEHCELDITEENYFYTCVPTGFPFSSSEEQSLGSGAQQNLQYATGTAYAGSGFWSVYHHIIWFGYTGTYEQNQFTLTFGNTVTDATTMIAYLNEMGLSTRISYMQSGWTRALTYWGYIKGAD